jgi:myo-inositol-1(or 4)-monophosphatase
MIKHARSVRINGCASLDLAYVACGRLDAYCDTGLFPWDISAARLLIAEAEGTFACYGDGGLQSQFCIGSNGRIQEELRRLVLAG